MIDRKEWNRKYYLKNKTKILERVRKNHLIYYPKNREKRLEYGKKYKQINKIEVKKKYQKYMSTDKGKILARRAKLKNRYGLTIEQYDQMFNFQNGLCAICGKPETQKNQSGAIRRLAVDHCHKTGKIRKLLCYNCNIVIGHSKESIETLANSIKYLSEFKEE